MPSKFVWSTQVRSYECNSTGYVNHAVYQQYLEEAGIQASAAAGHDLEWYRASCTAWVARRVSMEFVCPARGSDVLDVSTWISSYTRVRAERQYHVKRRTDGETIVKGCTDWVYVGLPAGRPRPIPREFFSGAFAMTDEIVLTPDRPRVPEVESGWWRWQHSVAGYELDTNQHVNNSVYLNWMEEAESAAELEAGWPPERVRDAGVVLAETRRDTEYLMPARRREAIEVLTRIGELDVSSGAWLHEVRRVGDGDLLARAYSTMSILDRQGRLASPPVDLIGALKAGSRA